MPRQNLSPRLWLPATGTGGITAAADDRIKTKVFGKDSLQVGKETVDLRFVEQLIDSEQTAALAQMLRYCVENQMLERYSVAEIVAKLQEKVKKEGLTSISSHSYGARDCACQGLRRFLPASTATAADLSRHGAPRSTLYRAPYSAAGIRSGSQGLRSITTGG